MKHYKVRYMTSQIFPKSEPKYIPLLNQARRPYDDKLCYCNVTIIIIAYLIMYITNYVIDIVYNCYVIVVVVMIVMVVKIEVVVEQY